MHDMGTGGFVRVIDLETTDPPRFPWFSRALRGSYRYQNASSQQVEAGPAITLPFQELESVDLALSLAAAPGFGERGAHCGAVLLQPSGERLDGADAARTGFGEPGVQVSRRRDGAHGLPGAATADESREPTREGGDLGGLRVLLGPPDGCGVQGR